MKTERPFAALAGPDCLKDVVTKVGPRLRVYSALRAIFLEAEPMNEVSIVIVNLNRLIVGIVVYTKSNIVSCLASNDVKP